MRRLPPFHAGRSPHREIASVGPSENPSLIPAITAASFRRDSLVAIKEFLCKIQLSQNVKLSFMSFQASNNHMSNDFWRQMSHKFFCHLGQFNRTQYNGPASTVGIFHLQRRKATAPIFYFLASKKKCAWDSPPSNPVLREEATTKNILHRASPPFSNRCKTFMATATSNHQIFCASLAPFLRKISANPYKRHNAVLRFRLKCLNCLLCTDLRQSEIRNNIESGWVWLSCSRMLHLFFPLLLLERCVCGQYLWATI